MHKLLRRTSKSQQRNSRCFPCPCHQTRRTPPEQVSGTLVHCLRVTVRPLIITCRVGASNSMPNHFPRRPRLLKCLRLRDHSQIFLEPTETRNPPMISYRLTRLSSSLKSYKTKTNLTFRSCPSLSSRSEKKSATFASSLRPE